MKATEVRVTMDWRFAPDDSKVILSVSARSAEMPEVSSRHEARLTWDEIWRAGTFEAACQRLGLLTGQDVGRAMSRLTPQRGATEPPADTPPEPPAPEMPPSKPKRRPPIFSPPARSAEPAPTEPQA